MVSEGTWGQSRMTRLVIVFGLFLLSGLGLGGSTTAQDDGSPAVQFTAFPVGDYENRWFEIEAAPGETIPLTAGVVNKGSAPIALRAFVANATNVPNGGFSASAEGDALAGPALWIDSATMSFEVAPGTVREWDFTLTLPQGTAPGQYVAAIVVATANAIAVPGSEVFSQSLRSAMAVEITVPGPPTPGFELGAPEVVSDVTGRSLEIPVINTGNVLVKPRGELVIVNDAGETVMTAPVAMGSVYAGLTVPLTVPLHALLPDGNYEVSVTLADPGTGATATLSSRLP